MKAKINKGLVTAPITDINAAVPAAGLSPAFGAALGGSPLAGQIGGKGKGASLNALSRPEQLNKAPKPVGGPNRTAGPRKGHR